MVLSKFLTAVSPWLKVGYKRHLEIPESFLWNQYSPEFQVKGEYLHRSGAS
jgi:hypothetical protein